PGLVADFELFEFMRHFGTSGAIMPVAAAMVDAGDHGLVAPLLDRTMAILHQGSLNPTDRSRERCTRISLMFRSKRLWPLRPCWGTNLKAAARLPRLRTRCWPTASPAILPAA